MDSNKHELSDEEKKANKEKNQKFLTELRLKVRDTLKNWAAHYAEDLEWEKGLPKGKTDDMSGDITYLR